MPEESPRVVFAASMEGLLRGIQPLNATEIEAFAKAGINGSKFQPAYPLEVYLELQEVVVNSRFAHLDKFERYRALGRLFIQGFRTTLIGSTLLGLMKVIGPKRSIQRLTRSFRSANNFSEVAVEEITPTHFKVVVNYMRNPGFYQGVLETALSQSGARSLKIEFTQLKDWSGGFDISWSE